VTHEQIEQWNLPTRPTKQSDTRAKKFGSATSVELDPSPHVSCARSRASASNATSIGNNLNFCGPQKNPNANC